jgi:hypothetical protein
MREGRDTAGYDDRNIGKCPSNKNTLKVFGSESIIAKGRLCIDLGILNFDAVANSLESIVP